MTGGCVEKAPPPAPAVVEEPPTPPPSYTLEPDQKSIGTDAVYTTQPDETLLDVARRYDLGYTQLITANRGIDPWLPGVGHKIEVPTFYLLPDVPRKGIVINLVQQRLYYFPAGSSVVETYPIGVGVQGRATPLGTTKVLQKIAHPVWRPPPSIRKEEPDLPAVVPAGPDNPLGDYAFILGWPGYLIHGTNKPDGVGRNVSHGCIHLYPEDMERLYKEVPIGTPVRVIEEEIAGAWLDGQFYVAAYPTKEQADQLDVNQPVTPSVPKDLKKRVTKFAGHDVDRIDWTAVDAVVQNRSGLPVVASTPELAASPPAP